MRLINVLAATLIGVTIIAAVILLKPKKPDVILLKPKKPAVLESEKINNIAKQIIVKIEGIVKVEGQKEGTGIIVKKEGNTYTVLTNNHVVQYEGQYILITPNGKTYNFNSSDIRKLPNLDLVVVQFTSNDNYTVATLGDSNKLTESTAIYNAGWSASDSICLKGCYRFYNGIINGISPNPQDGYALIMSSNTLPGMSGGPILNKQGELVGINGQSLTNAISGAVDFAGIPINEYQKYENMNIKFYCGINGGLVTLFISQRNLRRTIPFISWKDKIYLDISSDKYCEKTAERWTTHLNKSNSVYVTHGIYQNGKPIICAVNSEGRGCTKEGLLLELKPGTNSNDIMKQMLDIQLHDSIFPIVI